MAAFAKLGLMPELIQAVTDMGWNLPTPIQDETIPLVLNGSDVCGAAPTGSGKTGAFALPVLQIAHEARIELEQKATVASTSTSTTLSPVILNSDDRDVMFAVSKDGLTCQSRHHHQWSGCRATTGFKMNGKFYFEVLIKDEGICRVGWANRAASFNLGTDSHGFGYGGTAKKSNQGKFLDYGEKYGENDVIGCYLDFDNSSIGFSKNGKYLGDAFVISSSQRKSFMYPCVSMKNAELEVNFGAKPFAHPIREGFVGINSGSKSNSSQNITAHSGKKKPLCIILEPTKDLAAQTFDCIAQYTKYISNPSISQTLLVGGVKPQAQINSLANGCDIIVGSLGRVSQLLSSGSLDLSFVRFFVLDEADEMLEASFRKDVLQIYSRIPKKNLQVLLFSATLHSPLIKSLAQQIMVNPFWVDLKGKNHVPETVVHQKILIDPLTMTKYLHRTPKVKDDQIHLRDRISQSDLLKTREGLSLAVKLIKAHVLVDIIENNEIDQAIIFTRTTLDATNLSDFLTSVGGGSKMANKYSNACLHGKLSTSQRQSNLSDFKNGALRFLICSNAAARGIDIVGLPFVINYTLPEEPEWYVHRVGRVGRAKKLGLALSLVSTVDEKVWYHKCGRWCSDSNGCGLWISEKTYLDEIEERLGSYITSLDDNLRFPYHLLSDAGDESLGVVDYGKLALSRKKNNQFYHTDQLRSAVFRLQQLEDSAQSAFLDLHFTKNPIPQ